MALILRSRRGKRAGIGAPESVVNAILCDKIMKVVSLELAKTLRDSGFPQLGMHMSYYREDGHFLDTTANLQKYGGLLAAPTADEILDQLPKYIEVDGEQQWLMIEPLHVAEDGTANWWVHYKGDGFNHVQQSYSLAEAAAKLWVYIKCDCHCHGKHSPIADACIRSKCDHCVA